MKVQGFPCQKVCGARKGEWSIKTGALDDQLAKESVINGTIKPAGSTSRQAVQLLFCCYTKMESGLYLPNVFENKQWTKITECVRAISISAVSPFRLLEASWHHWCHSPLQNLRERQIHEISDRCPIQSYSNLLQEFVLLYYNQTSIKRPTSG